jgi:hypothetical protein
MYRPFPVSQSAMFEQSQISKSVDSSPFQRRHHGVNAHISTGHTRTKKSCIHCTRFPRNGKPLFTFSWSTLQRGLHCHLQDLIGHNLQLAGHSNFERCSKLEHWTLEDQPAQGTSGPANVTGMSWSVFFNCN